MSSTIASPTLVRGVDLNHLPRLTYMLVRSGESPSLALWRRGTGIVDRMLVDNDGSFVDKAVSGNWGQEVHAYVIDRRVVAACKMFAIHCRDAKAWQRFAAKIAGVDP